MHACTWYRPWVNTSSLLHTWTQTQTQTWAHAQRTHAQVRQAQQTPVPALATDVSHACCAL
eukprot:7647049-Alexandrium_andersonii.AAC.1